MTKKPNNWDEIIEKIAEAGFNDHMADNWSDIQENSIEKQAWKRTTIVMINELWRLWNATKKDTN